MEASGTLFRMEGNFLNLFLIDGGVNDIIFGWLGLMGHYFELVGGLVGHYFGFWVHRIG